MIRNTTLPVASPLVSKARRKHWYFITVQECPVCGRGDTFRERRYGKRPADSARRYEFMERYDHCNDL